MRILKLSVITLFLGLFVGVNLVNAQEKPQTKKRVRMHRPMKYMRSGMKPHIPYEKWEKDLGLTEPQLQKIKNIRKADSTKMVSLRMQLQELRKEQHEEIQKVLTAEQRQKLQEKRTQMKKRRIKMGKNREESRSKGKWKHKKMKSGR